jgi:hypothetical protein
MPTIRLLPPTNVQFKTLTVNGRVYIGTVGTPLDVVDFDADVLCANNWTRVAAVGPTTARLSNPLRGAQFIDSTLNVAAVFDGANWRNAVTGVAV